MIAVVFFLAAAFCLFVTGITLLLAFVSGLSVYFAPTLAVALFFALVTVAAFAIDRGLLRLKNWARTCALILTVLSALNWLGGVAIANVNWDAASLALFLSGILVIHLGVVVYLLLPRVRAAFRGNAISQSL